LLERNSCGVCWKFQPIGEHVDRRIVVTARQLANSDRRFVAEISQAARSGLNRRESVPTLRDLSTADGERTEVRRAAFDAEHRPGCFQRPRQHGLLRWRFL